jgi:hypothetical protein
VDAPALIPPHPTLPERATRARTRPGRLARLDAALCAWAPRALTRRDGAWAHAPVVDLGFSRPETTLELQDALGTLPSPPPRVIGVEIDPARVAAARAQVGDRLDLRVGGVDLPLGPDEAPRLVRALNVLRQYRPAEAEVARARLCEAMLDGGLLLEGSTSADGALGVAGVWTATPAGPRLDHILFVHDDPTGFHPRQWLGWLPRGWRDGARPTGAAAEALERWTAAWDRARAPTPRESWRAVAHALRDEGAPVDLCALDGGVVLWHLARPGLA